MGLTGRSRWRTTGLVLLALVAAWLLTEVTWRLTGTSAPLVDYAARLEAISIASQPDGADGWSAMIEAITASTAIVKAVEEEHAEAIAARSGDRQGFWFQHLVDANPERFAPEHEALRRLEAEGVLDLLDRVADAPRAVRPYPHHDTPLLDLVLPALAHSRTLAGALVASMHLAARNADDDALVRALRNVLAEGRAIGGQPILINRLVARAIWSVAFLELRSLLIEEDFEEETLQGLLTVMNEQARIPPFSFAIEGERAFALDTIQRCFTDDGHGDGRLGVGSWSILNDLGTDTQELDSLAMNRRSSLTGRLMSLLVAGRRETTEAFNHYYDDFQRLSDMRPMYRIEHGIDFDSFVESIPRRQVLLKLILPAIDRAQHLDDSSEVLVQGTRLMLMLAIHELRHGALPTTLDHLDDDLAAPADPCHGGPFVYELIEDDPWGRRYLLRSTGVDGTAEDDFDPDNRKVWAEGEDVLVNAPRDI